MSAHKLLHHPVFHLSAVLIVLCSILLAATILLSHSKNASAAVSSCTASVSPTNITVSTSNEFTFTLNNTSSETIVWVKITRPSSNFTLGGVVSNGGFNSTASDSESKTFSNGTLSAGNSTSVRFDVTSGSSEASSADWTVQVSDDSGGASPTSCTGTLGTAISGDAPDTSDPEISDLTLSDITSSSIKITWTTNENANSVINYGTTDNYGSTESSSTLTTSHSISLSNLSANTTYHFNVTSSDASNNTGDAGDNTFTTAKAGLTSDPITITTTTTKTITPTPTPTPIPDRTPPTVSITTDLTKPFLVPPEITGKASDASGVGKVEYSVDDGRNWNRVDEIPNLGADFVTFTFTPPPLDDDNYKLKIRATDDAPAKNVRVSTAYTLIIDRLPPAIGGNIISIGPQVLFPGANEYLLTVKGVNQKITLAAVGGPVEINLLAYHPGASESASIYKLVRNPDNSLWSANLNFDAPGIYQLEGKSVDGAGNQTSRMLNKIAVTSPGAIFNSQGIPIKNAKVTLYYFEEKYQIWRIWDGPSYGQKKPTKTNELGEFSLLVPSGKYYLDIQAAGYTHAISEIFEIDGPTILNPAFQLNSLTLLLDLGIFKLYLPDFSTTTVPVKISTPNLPRDPNSLVDKQAPRIELSTSDGADFDLFAVRGTPSLLSFMNLWSPQTTEQITALENLSNTNYKTYAVMIGNTVSRVSVFKKRYGYKTPFVVDPDGTLIENYELNTLPTHYFLDRRGVVKKVYTGILTSNEIEEMLLEIQ